MSIYALKPRFQALLRPLVRGLYRGGVTANQVTIGALLLSLGVGGWLCWQPQPLFFLALPGVLFVRMALNAIDGMLAREFHQQSRLGAVLNEVSDIVADAALFLPFSFALPDAHWLVLLCVFLATLSEFVGLQGLTLGASRHYDGPMGKSDRAFVIGAYALALALWPAAWSGGNWVFGGMAILLCLTCLRRVHRSLEEAEEKHPKESR